jgi:hypothetical protein
MDVRGPYPVRAGEQLGKLIKAWATSAILEATRLSHAAGESAPIPRGPC